MMVTKEGQAAALDWLGSPFTQDILAAAREMARPHRPRVTEPCEIAMTVGETIGANSVLDFLSNPHLASKMRATGTGMPHPSYGARDIAERN